MVRFAVRIHLLRGHIGPVFRHLLERIARILPLRKPRRRVVKVLVALLVKEDLPLVDYLFPLKVLHTATIRSVLSVCLLRVLVLLISFVICRPRILRFTVRRSGVVRHLLRGVHFKMIEEARRLGRGDARVNACVHFEVVEESRRLYVHPAVARARLRRGISVVPPRLLHLLHRRVHRRVLLLLRGLHLLHLLLIRMLRLGLGLLCLRLLLLVRSVLLLLHYHLLLLLLHRTLLHTSTIVVFLRVLLEHRGGDRVAVLLRYGGG